ADGMLPSGMGGAPDPIDLLGDLVDPEYLEIGQTERYPLPAKGPTQRWLRSDPSGRVMRVGDPLTEQEYSHHSDRIRTKFSHMLATGGHIPDELKTKKFAQRVLPARWGPKGPTVTATS